MFHYDIKMLSKISSQFKKIKWFFVAAKKIFDNHHNHRFVEWNVKFIHKNICVLMFKNWKNFDSMKLLNLFDFDNCSTTQTTRLRYQYENHCIFYAKIVTWFFQFSKLNFELNNFMNNRYYQFMNVFHICHHNICINHEIYESIHINHVRKTCCETTKKLRREKKKFRNIVINTIRFVYYK